MFCRIFFSFLKIWTKMCLEVLGSLWFLTAPWTYCLSLYFLFALYYYSITYWSQPDRCNHIVLGRPWEYGSGRETVFDSLPSTELNRFFSFHFLNVWCDLFFHNQSPPCYPLSSWKNEKNKYFQQLRWVRNPI